MNGLAVITDPSEIDKLDDEARGQLITQALVESKSWLAVATKGTDPTPIAEFRAWAATVAEATKQRNLAQDIQLDAQEMVRRAERGIGLAVRNGQEAGTIKKQYEHDHTVNRYGPSLPSSEKKTRQSPTDFFPGGGGAQTATYAMTDDVTDEAFDTALTEAKAEGNLSRANVVRKVTGTGSSTSPAARRRPITDQAKDAGWDIRKSAERITRILQDDRLPAHKQQVSAALRNHLLFVAEAVAAALNELPGHN